MTETVELKLTAYQAQVLIGTSIYGCRMAPDRVFDLPAAWATLREFGLIDRTDGLAIVTPKGKAMIDAMLTRSDPAVRDRVTDEARFARLYGICRRILWTNASMPAIESAQTKDAMSDLAEFLFMDGVDAALRTSPPEPASGWTLVGCTDAMAEADLRRIYKGDTVWSPTPPAKEPQ